jgi:ABC-type transport system involved in multi-copper enzyme maturation permease subunit
MTVGNVAPLHTRDRAGHARFGHVLRAEWTKFRTVRGWVVGMVVAALVTVLFGVLSALASHSHCFAPPGQSQTCADSTPLGPDGEQVSDSFYFVHQMLDGNGSITVKVTSMTGLITYTPAHPNAIVPGVVPWAKAGVIIEPGTRQGSAYAAVMVTGSHGVRMQYNYTHDLAGLPGRVSAASPRWLRLTRSGDTLTGYQSADGTHWARISTVTLAGLPVTVQAGLFVASPSYDFVTPGFAGGSAGHLANATAVFDHVSLQDNAPSGTWAGGCIGCTPDGPALGQGGLKESGGRFTVTGTGDIAPVAGGRGVEEALRGTFAGLIVVIVIGVMFVTAEYRRGLIRTTLTASPRRAQVLAAKAIVIGSVAFAAGLAAAAVSLALSVPILRHNGVRLNPVTALTDLRIVVGTAALFAAAAVLAFGVGAVLRRSAGAVAGVIVTMVLPLIFGALNVVPAGAADLLLRFTPAAAFAIQQTLPQFPQVSGAYSPATGYFPLAPWAGLAVLCGYAALALILAAFLLRKRDA